VFYRGRVGRARSGYEADGGGALNPLVDARTTPRWLRVPTLVAVGLLLVYLFVSYRQALAGLGVAEPPAGITMLNDIFWLGRWRMFTELRNTHTDLEVELRAGASRTPVDLTRLYPSRWPDGPGYLRDDFYRHERRVAALAVDVCERVGTPGAEVGVTLVTWTKTLGQVAQPRTDARRQTLLTWVCGAPPPARRR
jgi:hypothetical protein